MKNALILIAICCFLSSFRKENKKLIYHYQDGWLFYWGDTLLATGNIVFVPSDEKNGSDSVFFQFNHNQSDSIGFSVSEYYVANKIRPLAKKYQMLSTNTKLDGTKYDIESIALIPVRVKYTIDTLTKEKPVVSGKAFNNGISTINVAYFQYCPYGNLEINLLKQKDKSRLKQLRKNKTPISLPPIH